MSWKVPSITKHPIRFWGTFLWSLTKMHLLLEISFAMFTWWTISQSHITALWIWSSDGIFLLNCSIMYDCSGNFPLTHVVCYCYWLSKVLNAIATLIRQRRLASLQERLAQERLAHYNWERPPDHTLFNTSDAQYRFSILALISVFVVKSFFIQY